MSVGVGTRLGSLEIIAPLGKGGMGEVYRARDTKLKRDVAIKILPDEFARDADRVKRFQREAEVLASLNHPNIAGIYDLEQADSTRFLVMELVEGETLADRIKRGPVPMEEALQIAKSICEALEAAHEKGIVHRDLKPANVKITPDRKVKVLDFGLAKAFAAEDANADLPNSPTLVSATAGGMILGTAAYMSPEQARGKQVDRRTDIWAFACVLFEMLTGRRAFDGESVTDLFASIIKSDPDWHSLPPSTPEPVRVLMRHCLQKDAQHRLQHIGDARIALEDAIKPAAPAVTALPVGKRRARLTWAITIVSVLTAAVSLAVAYYERTGAAPAAIRFIVPPPEGVTFVPAANSYRISPDGRLLMFIARDGAGRSLVWIRPLDSLTAQPLPGTDGPTEPFWSPDSRFIAFFAEDGKLKRISVTGGPPQTICEAPQHAGGAWSPAGIILFGDAPGPIQRVPATGGTPSPALALDESRHEVSQRGPETLPDGRHFLYQSFTEDAAAPSIYIGSLDSKQTQILSGAPNLGVFYAAPGYLLFVRDRSLMAQPFDSGRLKLTAEAFPITEDIDYVPTGPRPFSVSQNGTLSYRTGRTLLANQLQWFDRAGKALEAVGMPGAYQAFDLSPDGKRAVVYRSEGGAGPGLGGEGLRGNLWLFESTRGIMTRFTFDSRGRDASPVWSPDGARVAFASNREGAFELYQKISSGAGSDESLLKASGPTFPTQWSFDGRFIVYEQAGDLWLLPTSKDGKPAPLIQTKFNESEGQFSPDGRWITYTSNESGSSEVYVQPFPATGAKWQISASGGTEARWNPNGKELFYISTDRKLMSVTIRTNGANFEAEPPKILFQTRLFSATTLVNGHRYAVSPNGQRFLMITTSQEQTSMPITVVVNWNGGSKR
jgi:Tol biopolymer transport system component/predicted Ser/Thr protein kinase